MINWLFCILWRHDLDLNAIRKRPSGFWDYWPDGVEQVWCNRCKRYKDL